MNKSIRCGLAATVFAAGALFTYPALAYSQEEVLAGETQYKYLGYYGFLLRGMIATATGWVAEARSPKESTPLDPNRKRAEIEQALRTLQTVLAISRQWGISLETASGIVLQGVSDISDPQLAERLSQALGLPVNLNRLPGETLNWVAIHFLARWLGQEVWRYQNLTLEAALTSLQERNPWEAAHLQYNLASAQRDLRAIVLALILRGQRPIFDGLWASIVADNQASVSDGEPRANTGKFLEQVRRDILNPILLSSRNPEDEADQLADALSVEMRLVAEQIHSETGQRKNPETLVELLHNWCRNRALLHALGRPAPPATPGIAAALTVWPPLQSLESAFTALETAFGRVPVKRAATLLEQIRRRSPAVEGDRDRFFAGLLPQLETGPAGDFLGIRQTLAGHPWGDDAWKKAAQSQLAHWLQDLSAPGFGPVPPPGEDLGRVVISVMPLLDLLDQVGDMQAGKPTDGNTGEIGNLVNGEELPVFRLLQDLAHQGDLPAQLPQILAQAEVEAERRFPQDPARRLGFLWGILGRAQHIALEGIRDKDPPPGLILPAFYTAALYLQTLGNQDVRPGAFVRGDNAVELFGAQIRQIRTARQLIK